MEQVVCRDCIRRCGAARTETRGAGACKMGLLPVLARAGIHTGEEPCISGKNGSGTIFFSGCALHCRFCQNHQISHGGIGERVSVGRLRGIMETLAAKGVHNINQVNPTHFAAAIVQALETPLPVPVVWNSGGHDSVEMLRRMEGKIQVYMPDFKYAEDALARRFSGVARYREESLAAIDEMVRQRGPYQLDENGQLVSGVLIRHLVLPGHILNTRAAIRLIEKRYPPHTVLFSLMGQFTPQAGETEYPELMRTLTQAEYDRAQAALFESGLEDGYVQGPEAAGQEHVPAFDLTGVR